MPCAGNPPPAGTLNRKGYFPDWQRSRASDPVSASCGWPGRLASSVSKPLQRTLEIGARSYSSVSSILKNELDRHGRTQRAADGPAISIPTSAAPATSNEEMNPCSPIPRSICSELGLDGMAKAFGEIEAQVKPRRSPMRNGSLCCSTRTPATDTTGGCTPACATPGCAIKLRSKMSITAPRAARQRAVPTVRQRPLDRRA